MLKSTIFYNNEYTVTEVGTPQGGILSPMLANVALTSLDDYCVGDRHGTNPIVRYADDFVITAKTENEAKTIKAKIAEFLRSEIGLTLSDEKTHITNIHDGFNFLGFNIRKFRERSPYSKHHEIGKLIIKPPKERIKKFLQKVQEVLKQNRQATADKIINLLNPMLQGFALYYRFVVSKEVFTYIQDKVWRKLWRWCRRRHPRKPKRWIFRKYHTFKEKAKGIFYSQETKRRLIQIWAIPIVRFKKIISSARVHAGDKESIEYWKEREYVNALNQIYSIKVGKLFKRQNGTCPCCEKLITKEQIARNQAHIHHLEPRSESGTDEPNNLRLLHLSCHKSIHSILSRKQMAYWVKKKLNYVGLKCILDIKKRPFAYAIVV